MDSTLFNLGLIWLLSGALGCQLVEKYWRVKYGKEIARLSWGEWTLALLGPMNLMAAGMYLWFFERRRS